MNRSVITECLIRQKRCPTGSPMLMRYCVAALNEMPTGALKRAEASEFSALKGSSCRDVLRNGQFIDYCRTKDLS